MISFHSNRRDIGDASKYSRGFEALDTVDVNDIARCAATYTWSPCVWLDGRRLQDNFLSADFIGLDFDSGLTLDQAKNIFCDSIHVIGVTRNHQRPKNGLPAADRFRVVLKLERRIEDLATMRKTSRYYIERWDADGQCVDGARLFFPCREIVSVNSDGETWPVIQASEREILNALPREMEPGELSSFALWFMRNEVPIGNRNTSCHIFAKDMLRAHYPFNDVFEFIRRSPTYVGVDMPRDLIDEINQAMRSAERAIKEEERKRRECKEKVASGVVQRNPGARRRSGGAGTQRQVPRNRARKGDKAPAGGEPAPRA